MIEKHENLGNGIFSANKIRTATEDIVHSGLNLDKFASKNPMTEEAKARIFVGTLDPKFDRYWEDRRSNPDAYMGWQNDEVHNTTVHYMGRCEIEKYKKGLVPFKIEGEINLYDPHNILTDVAPITINQDVTLKIYNATKPMFSADFGIDVQNSGIEQCVKCLTLGIDLLANNGLNLAASFGTSLRSGTYNDQDLNGTQLGTRQANYGTLVTKSNFSHLSAKSEEAIDYSTRPLEITPVAINDTVPVLKNEKDMKKYKAELKNMSDDTFRKHLERVSASSGLAFFATKDEAKRRDRLSRVEKSGKEDKTIKLNEEPEIKPSKGRGNNCCS